METYWTTRLTYADARAEQLADQRRADARDRRADLYRQAASELGSQNELARDLGVSRQAVSLTIHPPQAAQHRLPDLLEHHLPSLATHVPTHAEWNALPADEQQPAARRAASTWSTIARYAQHQASVAMHLSEEMATCQMAGPADPDDREDGDPYAPRPMPEIVAAAVGPEAAKGVLLEGDETISALQRTLADLAASWRQHSRTAGDQHTRWTQRAGDSRGMHYAE
jgi:hypothetical protein